MSMSRLLLNDNLLEFIFGQCKEGKANDDHTQANQLRNREPRTELSGFVLPNKLH